MAELFHLLGNPVDLALLLTGQMSASTVVPWLSAITAAVVVAKPDGVRSRAFLALCVLVVVDLVVSAPVVGNHQMILALGSLVVLATAAWPGAGAGGRGPEAVTGSMVSGLRWLLLIAYGLIAFSKLNSDFVNPMVSCAVVFGNEMSEWFGVSVSDSVVASRVAVYGSLITELAVSVMLAFRRLRTYGVVLALAFHGLLSLEPVGHVYDFTSVLIPLFVLFAPPSTHRRLTSVALRARTSAPLAVAATLFLILVHLIVVGAAPVPWLVAYPLWLGYLVTIGLVVVPSVLSPPDQSVRERPGLMRRHRPAPVAVAVLALALLNGVAPYVQLKTATAFNMYSNLRVLGDETNHFVVPVGLRLRAPELLTLQVAGDDDPLSFYPDRGLALPAANLHAYLDRRQDTTEELAVAIRTGVDSPVGVHSPVASPESTARDDRASFGRRMVTSLALRFGLWRSVDVDGSAQCLRVWGPAY